MPLDAPVLAELRRDLIAAAGGYLTNTVHLPRVTCAVCATPCPGHERCVSCRRRVAGPGVAADQVGMVVYGVAGAQSGYLMRGYKALPRPVAEHRRIVAQLALLGVGLHSSCAGRLLGAPVTQWAVVPSLPAKPADHPLRPLVAPAAPGTEVVLTAAPSVGEGRRAVSAGHFSAGPMPPAAHVLLVDDTWTSGGHALSAALSLRAAGAQRVSILVLARWILPGFRGNRAFLRGLAQRDFDPACCPWTGSVCP